MFFIRICQIKVLFSSLLCPDEVTAGFWSMVGLLTEKYHFLKTKQNEGVCRQPSVVCKHLYTSVS